MLKIFKLSVFKLSLLLTLFFMLLASFLEYSPERIPFLKSLALKVNVDAKFKLRGNRPLSEDIVIVAIDDKSIEKFGRWPWNRTVLAEGLQKMAHANPKTIAFDMVFSEPDPTSKTSDPLFTQTIQTANKNIPVLLGYFFYFSKKDIEELQTNWEEQFHHIFDSKITAKISTVRNPPEQIPTGVGAKSSFEPYAKATRHHGFFDISSDLDGVIRQTHLIGKYQTTLFPSFGLKVAALALNREIVVQFDEYGIENIFFKNETLPVNERGEFWINYAGPAKTFPTFSFADIYSGKISPSHLKDKVILVGVTAKAVGDMRVTPTDSQHPGVEINATIVENLIHKQFLSRPSEFFLYELLFIFLVGILFGVLFKKLKALSSALIALLLLAFYIVADQKLFFEKGILADLFIPGCHLFFIFITTNAFKDFVEEKRSRQIRAAFQ
ncbi:MAG: CHASE2 domain-containing protein, partial [Deltaproteobacteria bacterium]|nr:CHASE2 domain-containing protein [Deltaproteobacteria bacterium]